MKVLHLTLKKKWFDMIASGEKKEEYREIKDYWTKRLGYWHDSDRETGYSMDNFIEFDIVEFKHGYAKDAPKIFVECESIEIGNGRSTWGADSGKKYFVIKLGEILNPSPVGRG